jgi:hypothetical protein
MAGPHRSDIDFDLRVHAIKIVQASVAHSRTGGWTVELIDRHQARSCIVDLGRILESACEPSHARTSVRISCSISFCIDLFSSTFRSNEAKKLQLRRETTLRKLLDRFVQHREECCRRREIHNGWRNRHHQRICCTQNRQRDCTKGRRRIHHDNVKPDPRCFRFLPSIDREASHYPAPFSLRVHTRN